MSQYPDSSKSAAGTAPAPRQAGHDRRQRRLLVGIALLFFAPLAVSFYLYYGRDNWRPGGRVNRGDLIDPARPLPEIPLPIAATSGAASRTSPDFLRRKWTLLYWGTGGCDERCRVRLYDMRQVRLALNRDMTRVQRVFVAEGVCCDFDYLNSQHPDLVTLRDTAEAARLLAVFPAIDGVAPRNADRIYLIDPLGNLMMSYAPTAKPKGMLEDIKRLLGLSSVG